MNTPFERHIAWTSETPLGLKIDRAEGPYLFLADGRRITDFISGIAVSSIGHRHPAVLQAIEDQLERHLHVMVYGEFEKAAQVQYATNLASNLPPELQVIYFTMSGTEANEGALKLAKKYTGRSKLIAFEGSFHGDTHGSLSVTGRSIYRSPFEPLLPNVSFLPFNEEAALNAIDDQTACVITEPIQGEGGINVPSEAYLPGLRRLCDENGWLLMLDEIQTGNGRTGHWFAWQHQGVMPDVMTLAKGLANGVPIGACLAHGEAAGVLTAGTHGSTFGGNPLACSASLAVIDVIEKEDLIARASALGERIKNELTQALSGTAGVREIRGRGLMIGIELDRACGELVGRAMDAGLLINVTTGNVIRLLPPLVMTDDEADVLVGKLTDVVNAFCAREEQSA